MLSLGAAATGNGAAGAAWGRPPVKQVAPAPLKKTFEPSISLDGTPTFHANWKRKARWSASWMFARKDPNQVASFSELPQFLVRVSSLHFSFSFSSIGHCLSPIGSPRDSSIGCQHMACLRFIAASGSRGYEASSPNRNRNMTTSG